MVKRQTANNIKKHIRYRKRYARRRYDYRNQRKSWFWSCCTTNHHQSTPFIRETYVRKWQQYWKSNRKLVRNVISWRAISWSCNATSRHFRRYSKTVNGTVTVSLNPTIFIRRNRIWKWLNEYQFWSIWNE
jgi:hypothetical protein